MDSERVRKKEGGRRESVDREREQERERERDGVEMSECMSERE